MLIVRLAGDHLYEKKLFTWGAFDLPESESGFEIMILIHRFI